MPDGFHRIRHYGLLANGHRADMIARCRELLISRLRLGQALTCFADNSRQASPWAAAVYARAKSRGCDHPHAVRILARARVRVPWRA
jgi:hypothetical protein